VWFVLALLMALSAAHYADPQTYLGKFVHDGDSCPHGMVQISPGVCECVALRECVRGGRP
jgi:hypothetical protein